MPLNGALVDTSSAQTDGKEGRKPADFCRNHPSQDAESMCEKNRLLRVIIYMQWDCNIK